MSVVLIPVAAAMVLNSLKKVGSCSSYFESYFRADCSFQAGRGCRLAIGMEYRFGVGIGINQWLDLGLGLESGVSLGLGLQDRLLGLGVCLGVPGIDNNRDKGPLGLKELP